ncbi:MAG: hypothetical protein PHQ23_16905 [Candidatus Wallbacteria bacterium]|nr:hypothetical protein [Candidatus Wallbacteria bacterium]
MKLTEKAALCAYAKMINTLSIDLLEPLLAEDFAYESQKVLQPLKSKQAFLEYMVPKLQTISSSGTQVFAEMGTVDAYCKSQPCVILAQNNKSNLVAIVLAKVDAGKLKRLDLCIVPPPHTAQRSGDYPT